MIWLMLLTAALFALSTNGYLGDEGHSGPNPLGIAFPDPATGKLVFHDRGGAKLLLSQMNYPATFAQESFCPDRIVIGQISIRTGNHEAALVRKLGSGYRVLVDAHAQTPDSSTTYFRRVILEYPNTLRYYAVSGLQGLGGWFRLLAWDLPDLARLKVHLRAESRDGPYVACLLDLALAPTSPDSVYHAPGNARLLVRPGSPGATWDLARNVVTIPTLTEP